MAKLMKPVVASDLEGTITAAETWRGMRDYLQANGRAHLYRRFFRRRLPQVLAYRLGLVRDVRTFKENWVLDILGLCQGMTRAEFQAMADWLVENHLWPSRREAVVAELRRHKENGSEVLIISGMFQPILDGVARKLGVHGIGTPVAFDGDIFSGRIESVLNVGELKAAQLEAFLNGRPLLAAYGDTARDIPMLTLSEEAIAVAPDEGLRRAAEERGWRVLA